MSTWKILLTDGLAQSGQNILRAKADVTDRTGISAAEFLEEIPQYQAVIVRGRTKVTAEVLAVGASLKVVGRAGVGVDNIDLTAAKDHHVTVVNSPTATTIAVAEHTLGLMLSLVRHIPQADSGLKQGQWLKKQLAGSELHGKTLGVIGFGRIGAAVGQRASAFGMRVLAYDPILTKDQIRERGGFAVGLNELYAKSDIISLHVPLTEQTRGMINGQTLAQFKPGAFLICAARGGVIDETALLNALESGQIAGAGLDVFTSEPPGLSALVAHPHLVATPHIGAQTAEAQQRAAQDIASEVLNVLKGKPLHWKIV